MKFSAIHHPAVVPFATLASCCALFCNACAAKQDPAPITITDSSLAPAAQPSGMMFVPDSAKRTPSGFAYISISPGSGQKPSPNDAVNTVLTVRNIQGQIVDTANATFAIRHSNPFFEEILPLIEIGETIRVWGESRERIWDIQIVSVNGDFAAPYDAAAPPASASVLAPYSDVFWRLVENGTGPAPQDGQFIRVFMTRWNSDGEILESNRQSRGLIVLLNDEQKNTDPLHRNIFKRLSQGAHARLWIPGAHIGLSHDIVEDIWLAEILSELDPPAQLVPPASNPDVIHIQNTQFLRLKRTDPHAPLLQDGQSVDVSLACFNTGSGEIVDATALRQTPHIMQLTPEIGIWRDIMKLAAPGDSFITWIAQSDLPESVGLPLTCKVRVNAVVQQNGKNNAAPHNEK